METNASERLAALVRIPTVSAHIDTTGPAPFEKLIDALWVFYPVLHERLACERVTEAGLLYRWPGSDPELAREPVVLMAHFDVVPADEADPWTYPPFEGRIADGRVWGRGTLDDKGALVCICEAIESLLTSGFTPSRDIYLSFSGNEETYGDAARAIAATLRERGVTPHLVLDEGGAVVAAPLPWVKAPTAMVGVGEKGVMTVRLETTAAPGHASAPGKATAVARIGRAVARLTGPVFPARLPKTTATMLDTFAEHTTGAPGLMLKTLARFPALTAQIFGKLGGEAGATVRTTVAPTMIEGGTAANVLPSRASAVLNVRVAPGETTASVLARIARRIADRSVSVTMTEGTPASREAPTDCEQYRAIGRAVAAAYPGVKPAPYIMAAATDSRHFHTFTDWVYRFAPLAMDAAQLASVHGVDESVEISSLERGRVFYEHLVRGTTGGSGTTSRSGEEAGTTSRSGEGPGTTSRSGEGAGGSKMINPSKEA